jgi:O-antigen/teichoic acid export membrane protein
VAARVASIGFQGAAFALIARLLGPQDLGAFAGALALASLFGAASEFGLQNTTVVELGHRPDEAPATLARAYVASTLLGLAGLALAAPVALLAFDADAAVAFLALVPWSVMSRFSTPGVAWWQSRLEFRRIFAGEVVGRGSAVVGLAVLTAVRPDWTARHLVAVSGLILAAGALVQLVAVMPGAAVRLGARVGGLVRGALALVWIAAPLGVVSAVSLIHVRSDQILLELLGHGGSELGNYAVAYRVVEGSAGVLGAVATVGFSVLSRTAAADRRAVSRANSAVVAVVGLAGGLAALVGAPLLVAIVGGRGFGDAVWPTRLLSVVVVVSVLNMVPSLTVVAQRQAGRLLPIGVGVVVANIALNLALIPHFGATGSAVATIATELVGLALISRLASEVLPGSQRPELTAAAVVAIGVAAAGFAAGPVVLAVAGTVTASAILAVITILVLRSRRAGQVA